MDRVDGLRSVRRRLSDPVDSLAQTVAEHATDLVVRSLDINALLKRIAVDDLLDRVDLNTLLERVDIDRLLARVDVNSLAARIDIESLVEHTDLGSVIARSSSSVASGALDEVRSQAVRFDEFVARGVGWLLRRGYQGPPGPPELLR